LKTMLTKTLQQTAIEEPRARTAMVIISGT
jgi:hypothetical protein